MNPIPVTWCVGGALVASALAAGATWQVQEWRHTAKQADALRAQQKAFERQLAKANDIAAEYEAEREDARQAANARQVEIRTIYETVEVPAECEPPADAVRVLDNAISEANATPG